MLMAVFLTTLTLWGQTSWEWLTARLDLGVFVIGVGFAFYLVSFWSVGLLYILLSRYKKPHWLYRYKIQDEPSKPGRKSRVPLSKSVRVVLRNQLLGTLPFLAGLFYLMTLRGYSTSVAIPKWYIALVQFSALILIEEVFFFGSHYLLHQKYFFKRFHRVHHEYRESISIATHYVHFVEHLLGNLFPVFIGVFILMPHPFVIMFWMLIVVINALHTHAGYALPWMSYAVHHDWHHYYVNGSFSALGLMDKLFGTDRAFDDLKQKYAKARAAGIDDCATH